MRVLIVDVDFFSTQGGGQTFYRRVVERHPGARIFYPSRGLDVQRRDELPPNAVPFIIDAVSQDSKTTAVLSEAGFTGPVAPHHADVICAIGRAMQGSSFDVVEVPSYRPCAQLVRPVLAAHGVRVGRVCVGLLGWMSVSVRKAVPSPLPGDDLVHLEAIEAATLRAADAVYTISALHAAENTAVATVSGVVDMHDALEAFAPPSREPPGEGPPDLWYVGRLDPAKAPDLFLAIVARLPRRLYRRVMLTGPDSTWMPVGQRWSDAVMATARELGIDATYVSAITDADLRSDVYGGRTVVVIPSRTDAFNLVALEALAHGAPVLLSRHAGAAEFLRQHHPDIAPPVIEPQDVAASAAALVRILEDYPATAVRLRHSLRIRPLPAPRTNFLTVFWSTPLRPAAAAAELQLVSQLRAAEPLGRPPAAIWRPRCRLEGDISAVVVVRDNPEGLYATLAALGRQSGALGEILVIDDGSELPLQVAGVDDGLHVIRQGRRGLAAALNRGWAEARHPLVQFFIAGDLPEEDCTEKALACRHTLVEAAADAVGLPWGWLGPGGLGPGASGDPDLWSSPGLTVDRRGVLDGGGFIAKAGGSGVSPPAAGRLLHAPGDRPLVWRDRDATAPWRPKSCESGGYVQ